MKYLLTLLPLLFLGCYMPNQSTELRVSYDFNEDELNQIIKAAEQWEDKTNNGIKFTIKRDNKDPNVIKGYVPDVYLAVCRSVGSDLLIIVGPKVTLKNKAKFRGTIAHELGHFIGIQEHTSPEECEVYPQLMCAYVVTNEVTHRDAERACNESDVREERCVPK